MGSPDPDGRQIDGVGGGVSSLSKAAIVSAPGSGLYLRALRELGDAFRLPGVAWADDATRAAHPTLGWDVVYRFGQVPVSHGTNVDWSSTCGNMLAAAALFAVHNGIVRASRIAAYAAETVGADADRCLFPIRVLHACSGARATAHVPVRRVWVHGAPVWLLSDLADTAIAGVPGRAPGIRIDVPLEAPPLPTTRVRDSVRVGDRSVAITVVDTGLPVVLVRAEDLGAGATDMTRTATELDGNTALHARIEELRRAAAQLVPSLEVSPSAPKVCLVYPRTAYTTSGGAAIAADDMDVLVRAVSVGNFHRSIMATALSSLAVAAALPHSVVAEAVASPSGSDTGAQTTRSLRVGQPAGISTAAVQLDADGAPAAISYDRTARRILTAELDIPFAVASSWHPAYEHQFRRLVREQS